jgi:hypothetical protein
MDGVNFLWWGEFGYAKNVEQFSLLMAKAEAKYIESS